MSYSKVLAASLIAVTSAWCGAARAQTSVYLAGYGASSTVATPSLENSSPYPKHLGNAGLAVTGYWDHGVWYERTDPVMVGSDGVVRYVYPETARRVPPPTAIYVRPESAPYPAEAVRRLR